MPLCQTDIAQLCFDSMSTYTSQRLSYGFFIVKTKKLDSLECIGIEKTLYLLCNFGKLIDLIGLFSIFGFLLVR